MPCTHHAQIINCSGDYSDARALIGRELRNFSLYNHPARDDYRAIFN